MTTTQPDGAPPGKRAARCPAKNRRKVPERHPAAFHGQGLCILTSRVRARHSIACASLVPVSLVLIPIFYRRRTSFVPGYISTYLLQTSEGSQNIGDHVVEGDAARNESRGAHKNRASWLAEVPQSNKTYPEYPHAIRNASPMQPDPSALRGRNQYDILCKNKKPTNESCTPPMRGPPSGPRMLAQQRVRPFQGWTAAALSSLFCRGPLPSGPGTRPRREPSSARGPGGS